MGVPIADLMAGMYAAVATCAALRHAALSGEGQYIDVGMMDTTVAMLANAGMNYLHGGLPGRLGNAHPNIVPYQPFRTADGYIIVAIGNDGQFARFCDLAGRADLARDPDYATNDSRVRNREALLPVLRGIFRRPVLRGSGWGASRSGTSAAGRSTTSRTSSATPMSRRGEWWSAWTIPSTAAPAWR